MGPGRKASFIWNFYDADSFEKARCRLCKRIYSRKGSCTTGLINHLKKIHTDAFLLYLNKGLVRLENGVEFRANTTKTNIKKEPGENNATPKLTKDQPHIAKSDTSDIYDDDDDDEADERETNLNNFTRPTCSPQTTGDKEFHHAEQNAESTENHAIEQMCLDEDEYPILNIQRVSGKGENQFTTSSNKGTTEIESLLTKQLQIQAKMYKEIKEKLEQISTHMKEAERINRKRYRLKAEKIRLQKEEMQRKELHRKEMHRLRLLEIDILSKKNLQENLHYNQL